MKTQEFLSLLAEHQGRSLLFEYAPNQIVPANYHITEVKHVTIDSVDCGARTDAWKETIIQLWESPAEIGKTEFMSSYKALAILKKVGQMKPYELQAEVKLEYGNALFHTAQLFVNDYEIKGNNLIVKLAVEKTDCKAKEECGVPEAVGAETDESGCTPGGGCC
ncbi:MAG: hypothetical protein KJP09_05460 [Bacteroidia bacterium]|nr:hypothetical protein [Bacteroidia bacterium]NND11142.1 hypothetical protein [Flavobacteriaceae bacterium]MBT8311183.1 hypothetical protein [Bacteroidia bacterium]NNK27734.1 hypothetical protein [Flavobacteriaceae bacterium]NNL61201.1 hypothetical protein [Flavobacteriaceae bacterium]